MDVTNHTDTEALDPEALVEEPAESAAALAQRTEETERARRLAERYRLDFLDMNEFRIDQELFRSIPADLMLRYGFVPSRREAEMTIKAAIARVVQLNEGQPYAYDREALIRLLDEALAPK